MNIEVIAWIIEDMLQSIIYVKNKITKKPQQQKQTQTTELSTYYNKHNIDEEQIPTIDWINIVELWAFMLEEKWLPTEKTREKFGLSNKQIGKLWTNLEKAWILYKWKHNKRILKTTNRQAIMSVLIQAEDSDDISPLLHKQEWTNYYQLQNT